MPAVMENANGRRLAQVAVNDPATGNRLFPATGLAGPPGAPPPFIHVQREEAWVLAPRERPPVRMLHVATRMRPGAIRKRAVMTRRVLRLKDVKEGDGTVAFLDLARTCRVAFVVAR